MSTVPLSTLTELRGGDTLHPRGTASQLVLAASPPPEVEHPTRVIHPTPQAHRLATRRVTRVLPPLDIGGGSRRPCAGGRNLLSLCSSPSPHDTDAFNTPAPVTDTHLAFTQEAVSILKRLKAQVVATDELLRVRRPPRLLARTPPPGGPNADPARVARDDRKPRSASRSTSCATTTSRRSLTSQRSSCESGRATSASRAQRRVRIPFLAQALSDRDRGTDHLVPLQPPPLPLGPPRLLPPLPPRPPRRPPLPRPKLPPPSLPRPPPRLPPPHQR